jgi:hypothetical protein
LPPHGIDIVFGRGHSSTIPLVFNNVQVFNTPFQHLWTCSDELNERMVCAGP